MAQYLDTFDIASDIKVEVWGSTSFIIGQSKIGGPALLGDLTPTWHPLECGITRLNIERGFSVDQGILPSLEVGKTTIELQGFSIDPQLNPLFQLNAELRILVRPNPDTAPTTYEPIFVGFIDNINTTYTADGHVNATVEATDWLSKLMNITIESYYVEYAEPFDARVQRIFDEHIIPAYPSLAVATDWFPAYTGSVFPPEERVNVTTGELLNELVQGEAGMIIASRTGEIYGFGRYYYDNVILNPTYVPAVGSNMIDNSALEQNLNGWIGNNCNIQLSTEQAWQGTHSIRTDFTGLVGGPYYGPSGSRVPCTPGQIYTGSMYVKAGYLTKQMRATLLWYEFQSGGVRITKTDGDLTVISDSEWTRVSVTGTAPANANYVAFTVNPNTTVPVGQYMYVDGALLEEGAFLRTWYENTVDEGEPEDVPTWWGFSNVHNDSLDHFCMGDVETSFGKNDAANEITVGSTYDDLLQVLVKNTNSITALGNLPYQVQLNLDAPGANPEQYYQSWANDLSLPDGRLRVTNIAWTPLRRDGRLNNSWSWDPGAKVIKVHIEYPTHTIDETYIISKLTHEVTPDGWNMTAELWKGI